MREFIVEISKVGNLRKYLSVHIGKYPWRVNVHANIDHALITPAWEYWLSYGHAHSIDVQSSKLVHISMKANDFVPFEIKQSIFAIMSEEDRTYVPKSDNAIKILKLARKILEPIKNDEDLFRMAEQTDNFLYWGHYDRVIYHSSYLHLKKKLPIEEALKHTEEQLSMKLKRNKYLIEYWNRYKS